MIRSPILRESVFTLMVNTNMNVRRAGYDRTNAIVRDFGRLMGAVITPWGVPQLVTDVTDPSRIYHVAASPHIVVEVGDRMGFLHTHFTFRVLHDTRVQFNRVLVMETMRRVARQQNLDIALQTIPFMHFKGGQSDFDRFCYDYKNHPSWGPAIRAQTPAQYYPNKAAWEQNTWPEPFARMMSGGY